MRALRLLGAVSVFGTLVTFTAAGQPHLTTLYNITGDNPVGLTAARGKLYLAADDYGSGPGEVLELSPPAVPGGPWAAVVLYSFGAPGDGSEPAPAPLVNAGRALYGTTSAGGLYHFGVFYDLLPPSVPGGDWTEDVLYTFDTPGTNIGYPVSNIVPGPEGSFYVLTESSTNLCQLQPPTSPGGAWTATILYGSPKGSAGVALNSLAAGPNDVLYGTGGGGPGGRGVVFRLTPPSAPGDAWTEAVVHTFGIRNGPVDNPIALTVAGDGTIYGTAYGDTFPYGSGNSAIFQLTPPAEPGGPWTYANLTTPTSTEHFNTPVVMGNGNLYGGITTGTGGSIYELQPPSAPGDKWTMTTLYTFTNGQVPSGNLVVGPHGTLYGTTAAAPGQPSGGTVFALTTN